jgi:hypothetical protein
MGAANEDVVADGVRLRVGVEGLQRREAEAGSASLVELLESQAAPLPGADITSTYATVSLVQEFVVLVGSGLTTAGIAALVKQAFSRSERQLDVTVETDTPGRVEVHVRDRGNA